MIRPTRLLPLLLLLTTSCAQLMGGLRRDLDDGYVADPRPTRGGLLADLAEADEYSQYPQGGGYRAPASEAGRNSAQNGSWISRMGGELASRGPASDAGGDQRGQRGQDDEYNEEDSAPARRQEPALSRRATRSDFIDGAEDAGSLWSTGGQTNFFFSKNRTRQPGDLVTITIEADMIRDIAAEVKRSLRPEEREQEIALLEKSGAASKAGKQANVPATPAAEVKSDEVKKSSASPDQEGRLSFAQVDLQDAIGVKAGDTLLAEVVERFPNGNYKIRGTKRLPFRGATRLMTLVGVVRGNDLSDDDKVNSGKLYEYRLEAVR